MKIKDLIELLQAHDENLDVVLSSDPDGNGFYDLHSISTGLYCGEDQLYLDDTSVVDLELNNARRVLVIWP